MSPLLIVGGIGVIVSGLLGAGLWISMERLDAKAEQIGNLKVEVRSKQAVIDQKNADADLSSKLVNFEKLLNDRFSAAVQPARETIIAIQTKDTCPSGDPALAAAAAGVQRLRPQPTPVDPGQAGTRRQPAPAVR